MCFYGSLDQFIPVLLAYVALDLVSWVPSHRLAGKNISEMPIWPILGRGDVKP